MHVLQRAWIKLDSALDHNSTIPKATPFISLQFFPVSWELCSEPIIWCKGENFIATKYRNIFQHKGTYFLWPLGKKYYFQSGWVQPRMSFPQADRTATSTAKEHRMVGVGKDTKAHPKKASFISKLACWFASWIKQVCRIIGKFERVVQGMVWLRSALSLTVNWAGCKRSSRSSSHELHERERFEKESGALEAIRMYKNVFQ